MNFLVILALVTAFWPETSVDGIARKGKFFGYSSEDLWNDIFDEVQHDPFPVNPVSVRDHVMQKIKKKKPPSPQVEPVPPLPIPQILVESLASNNTTPRPTKIKEKLPAKPTLPPVIVYDSSTNKLELTPPGFASHPQPITEGMFVIGGQFGETSERPANLTDMKLKLFWSSVGDFIETVPFLPIQVNVPDLIAAMTTFFAQRIPLVNRLTNPNDPRPNAKLPNTPPSQFDAMSNGLQNHYQNVKPPGVETPVFQYSEFPGETNLLEYRQIVPSRKSKPKKQKKKTHKKNRRRTTVNHLKEQSTPRSQVSSKAWFVKPTEIPSAKATTTEVLKLFHHNNNPGSEQVKYKNTVFTRKNNRWADRELFNFKHSDISNSPIMILNMPSRPVYMYGFKHEQKTEYPKNENEDSYVNRFTRQ